MNGNAENESTQKGDKLGGGLKMKVHKKILIYIEIYPTLK